MKTIAELQAEHEKQIKSLQAQHEVASALPIPPDSVLHYWADEFGATYTRKTLAECLDIFRVFTVVPYEGWRDSCLQFKPEACISAKKRERLTQEGGPYACQIDTNQGEGFGPNASLEFFGMAGDRIIKVHCKFGNGYIGMCQQLAATTKTVRGYRDRVESRTFIPNEHLRSVCDRHVSWSSGDIGPVETSANISYLFQADSHGSIQGVHCTHAVGMLTNLADMAKV